jgi:hypothetical protein
VFNNITSVGSLGHGVMDRILRESDRTTGRVKQRVIQLDNQQRMDGIRQGFLRDDLAQILVNQYDQLSSELALREALEIGPGKRFSSWGERLKFVEEEYNQMIADAASAGDRKLADKLSVEKKVMIDDLVEARDRIRGNAMMQDGTSFAWANWLSAKLRQYNYVRFGGGFLLSSVTDLATLSLRTGSAGKSIAQYGKAAAKATMNLTRRDGIPANDIEAFVSAMELGMGAASHARRMGAEDLVHGPNAADGIGYGMTRQVTGTIDKFGNAASTFVAHASGLPIWNRFMKTVAAYQMTDRIRRSVAAYDQLTPVEVADLASVGIGRKEAGRFKALIEKHGQQSDGYFDPGLDKWPFDDARTFLMAIQRDMNRAINTPGVGDTPRLMSTWWGKLWLQFQTFSFTMINRYAYPVSQRISMGDRKAIANLGVLLAAGTLVVVLKDVQKGKDPTERFEAKNLPKTFYEIVDRSGLLGWTSPYVNAAATTAGFGGAERFQRQSALVGIAGVNAGVLSDLGKASSAVLNGDPDVVDKLLAVMPLATQSRLIHSMMTE